MGVLRGFAVTMIGVTAVISFACSMVTPPAFREASLVEMSIAAVKPTREDRFRVLQRADWATRQAGQGIDLPSDVSGGCGCAEVSGTSFWGGIVDGPGVDISVGREAVLRVRVTIPEPVAP
jgi:hypothetical protein